MKLSPCKCRASLYERDDVIDGGAVLPGFMLKLAEVFPGQQHDEV